jgi:hypothetical protein
MELVTALCGLLAHGRRIGVAGGASVSHLTVSWHLMIGLPP